MGNGVMYKQVGGNLWILPAKSENKHFRFGSCLGILVHGRLAYRIVASRRFAYEAGHDHERVLKLEHSCKQLHVITMG